MASQCVCDKGRLTSGPLGYLALKKAMEENGFTSFAHNPYESICVGQYIEVLCSFGGVHRYIVTQKRDDIHQFGGHFLKEVFVRDEQGGEEIVLDSISSNHYDHSWKIAHNPDHPG